MLVLLACLLAVPAGLSSVQAQGGPSASPDQRYHVYLPTTAQPWKVFWPLVSASGAQWWPWTGEQHTGQAANVHAAGERVGFVSRWGESLQLNGRPYSFVGTNVSYLAGPFFPIAKMEEVIVFLAQNGVEVVRVFVEPWCDLDRVERMLDLGGQYNLRFILCLQDFYGRQNGYWFKAEYQTKDLPHIRRIVPRFAQRPEVLMWELMNEPTCPPEDANEACWDALLHWARVTSEEIKRLDPNHLVSAGTYRAGFDQQSIDAFFRIHALDTIDIVSVHGQGGKLSQGEREKERAMARELGKPIYFGEVHLRGLDKQCQPLSQDTLQQRAEAIAADLQQGVELGIDGYLLWQYAYGGVDMGSHMQYFCGEFGYFADDPAWKVIRAIE